MTDCLRNTTFSIAGLTNRQITQDWSVLTCMFRPFYPVFRLFILAFFLLAANALIAQNNESQSIAKGKLAIDNQELTFQSASANGSFFLLNDDTLRIAGPQTKLPLVINETGGLYLLKSAEGHSLYHLSSGINGPRLRNIPLWLSVVPPLIAIVLALIFKEVISSLFIGIWSGIFIAGGLRLESFSMFFKSIWATVETYILKALTDSDHMSVVLFSLLIGGMVAIISRNGGMTGVVERLSKYAKSPTSAQFITWLLGVAIFFDDYANTLIVGNTMRSVTDKYKVSRAKLAYIVDSTAAPVASVAFITTWIGAELGYIDKGLQLIGMTDKTPYLVFLESLKYSFYPILTLVFILLVIYTKCDFGPMLKAERDALRNGSAASSTATGSADQEHFTPHPRAPHVWWQAALPVLTVILVTIYGLFDTGFASQYNELSTTAFAPATDNWSAVWAALANTTPEIGVRLGVLIGSANSYVALLWSSLSGVLVAVALTLGQRILNLEETMESMINGFKAMLPAIIILALAWSLAATTDALHTATFLSASLADSIPPYLFPAMVFILSAFISFSTGSSWSTMAILYPLAIPTAWAVGQAQGLPPDQCYEILLNVIATVLAASVLGDHCSPISDTTILSSLASQCNHIEHVRTQMPYSLTVGAFSITMGSLATYFGGHWLLCLVLVLISILGLYFILRWRGKPTLTPAEAVE